MRHLEIDFTQFGHSRVVRALLFPEEREGLEVGMHVLVEGDTVAAREAVVTRFSEDRREVTLELV